ncbi:ABC transporter substrate-binding protein [Amphritea balenae]|uniref:ABC transporter substrate-binding protein n=1 Tax=Amphritea balenae TaxID=452629 RepID=A0A3P1STN1_9GAMM|nr:ABC transporter substrate binding protein [Amphritea balenae]RRC99532.1 hypothetical protein EHS89_08465 [Amphritea balenae]
MTTPEVASGMTTRLAVILLMWVVFAYFPVNASTLIVQSDASSTYQEVTNTLIKESPSLQFETLSLEQLKEQPESTLAEYPLLITVGTNATAFVLEKATHQSTILSTFIPSQRFEQLNHQYAFKLLKHKMNLTGVFLDQPVKRQLQLAQLIQPELKTLGLTLGPNSIEILPKLKLAANELGIELNYEALSQEDNPIQRIQPIIKESDLFLVIPDRNTFNQTTAKWLLYMSYRNRKPLIAFSQNYVKAGAIAACISSPEDIGRMTAQQLKTISSGVTPPPTYSPFFSVVTNSRAARQIHLAIPTAERLRQQLLEVEKR